MVNLLRYHASVAALGQLMVDVGLFFAALLLAVLLQRPSTQPLMSILPSALLFGSIMALMNAAFGLYRREHPLEDGAFVRRAILAMLIGFPIAYAVYFTGSRGTVLQDATPYAVLFGLSLAIALRKPVLSRTAGALFPRRILVIGSGHAAFEVDQTVRALSGASTVVVGFVPLATREEGIAVPRERLTPPGMAITTLVSRLKVDEIVVAAREQRGGVLPIGELLACRAFGVRVSDLSGFFERMRGEVPIESLKASWLIYGDGFRQGVARRFVKRVFDLVASAVLLVVAAPVIVVTALAILAEGGGPVIFRQERVGRGGRTFTVLKFRSMRHDAEAGGKAQWAAEKDERVTAVGRLIRKLRIDELPQLLNVLAGEMSLVGPRPERPCFVADLAQEIPFYELRHSVKPGITGWAQVRWTYGASVEDSKRKLQFDLYYVKNHSLFLDLLIAIETIRVVLFAKGSR
jgi:sugar transferase (PEP-CTERM system associated)